RFSREGEAPAEPQQPYRPQLATRLRMSIALSIFAQLEKELLPWMLPNPTFDGWLALARMRHWLPINNLRSTGCSSAWLERYVRDVEVAGSNPVTPTR